MPADLRRELIDDDARSVKCHGVARCVRRETAKGGFLGTADDQDVSLSRSKMGICGRNRVETVATSYW